MHSANIGFGVRRNHARKVARQLKRARLVKGYVERAKQLALYAQFRGTSVARFQVSLETR